MSTDSRGAHVRCVAAAEEGEANEDVADVVPQVGVAFELYKRGGEASDGAPIILFVLI